MLECILFTFSAPLTHSFAHVLPVLSTSYMLPMHMNGKQPDSNPSSETSMDECIMHTSRIIHAAGFCSLTTTDSL